MTKKNTFSFLFLQFLCFGLLQAQTTVNQTVLFESDQYTLSPEAISILDELTEISANASTYSYQLQGHTDGDGSDDYNRLLSKKRTDAVQQYLIQQGIDQASIQDAYFGEQAPIDQNDNELGKGKNRRVEISLTYHSISSADELFSFFVQKNKQSFLVSPQKATELKAKNGTIVRVPADAFSFQDGSPLNGEIYDIEIEEAIRPSEMIFYKLNTAHGDQTLSTGGMIRVTAKANGEVLRLKDGKALDIFIPTNEPNETMQLYTGTRGNDDIMDWDELDEPLSILDEDEVTPEKIVVDVPFPKEILSVMDEVALELPEHPGKLRDVKLPALLQKPSPSIVPMKKPYEPGKPERQIARKPKGIFNKLAYNEKEEQQKLDTRYQERMKKYEERVKKYEVAMLAYKKNRASYKEELAAIDRQFKIDNNLVIAERQKLLDEYVEKCKAYDAAYQVQQMALKFKHNLSESTVKEKLFPSSKKRPAEFAFSLSLVAVRLYAEGKELGYGEEPRYSEYLLEVDRIRSYVKHESGYASAINTAKRMFKEYAYDKAEFLKGQNSAAETAIANTMKYYNFKITAPDPFWCNIDTPRPPGKELLAFRNNAFTELYTFRPRSKTVNYFPLKEPKRALYALGEQVNYIAFRFSSGKIELAKGNVKVKSNKSIDLKFSPSSLAKVERAILSLNAS